MKAKKLEAILERYPWLEYEFKGPNNDQKPDHRKLEFVAIGKMDNSGQFGDARVKLQCKHELWELTTWTVVFRIGEERPVTYYSVAWPDGKDRQDEQTVSQVIQLIKNFYNECWEGKAPIEFIAVLKRVFSGQGSIVLPTRVTVYLFN